MFAALALRSEITLILLQMQIFGSLSRYLYSLLMFVIERQRCDRYSCKAGEKTSPN